MKNEKRKTSLSRAVRGKQAIFKMKNASSVFHF